MRNPKLPTGIDNFKKIRNGNYYYVDKTSLVEQILNNGSEVTLFTRPRRFGKSLNMSMIQHFFEIGTDPALFDGLKISKNTEICEQYMGKYPVISISLKGIDADSYEKARAQLIKTINREARRFQFLLESDKLSRVDKALFSELLTRNMEEDTITSSLQELTELLEIHYGQKVIVLIDEYDVPLDKAFENNYYNEMIILLRNMLEQSLKTNDKGEAVVTGWENTQRHTVLTKVPQAMKVFSEMILLYSCIELLKHLKKNKFSDFDSFKRSLSAKISRSEWMNIGGQLIMKAETDKLKYAIRTNKIKSWDEVHQFYKIQGEHYEKDKLHHAYTSLLEILNITSKQFTSLVLKDVLLKVTDTKQWMSKGIYEARAKDYVSPYRKMVYETNEEMNEVLGRIEDNSFVQEQFADFEAFKKNIKFVIRKLNLG